MNPEQIGLIGLGISLGGIGVLALFERTLEAGLLSMLLIPLGVALAVAGIVAPLLPFSLSWCG